MNWQDVLYIVASIAVVALGAFGIPYLKTKVNKEKLSKVKEWAVVFVEAAEKLAVIEGWDKNEKFQYVMTKIKEVIDGLKVYFTDEQITALIESTVYEVKETK